MSHDLDISPFGCHEGIKSEYSSLLVFVSTLQTVFKCFRVLYFLYITIFGCVLRSSHRQFATCGSYYCSVVSSFNNVKVKAKIFVSQLNSPQVLEGLYLSSDGKTRYDGEKLGV